MKKLKVVAILLIVCMLQGCGLNNPKYLHFGSKHDDALYTKEVYYKILNNEDFHMVLFINNLYKDIPIDASENDVVKNFIASLSDKNYEDKEIPDGTEPYELRIEFDDGGKYIINVYDNNKVILYPWDGNYEEDVINMQDVPIHYNLYDFCQHIENTDKSLK